MTYVERGELGADDGFEDNDYDRVRISDRDARAWRRWAIEPIDAARWLQAGVDEALTAAQWRTAGVAPTDVRRWVDAGLTSTEAVQWHEMGVGPETAIKERAAGRKPGDHMSRNSPMLTFRQFRGQARARGLRAQAVAEALPEDEGNTVVAEEDLNIFFGGNGTGAGYLQIGWVDTQARHWLAAGIDALDAKDWLLLGFTMKEAAALEPTGQGPVQVLLAWTRAGIPADEVADWCGAGLSPDEAVAQRASGVTVEQAAVMRSLRQADL